MWELARTVAVVILTISVFLSLGNPRGETRKGSFNYTSPSAFSRFHILLLGSKDQLLPSQQSSSLQYDFYRDTCPHAEQIIRSTVRQLFSKRSSVAPALLRLVFHDCFIQGCDASILLENANEDLSEKEAIPNQSLKGFDVIDMVKSKLEEACPGTVSCADILVLAAREGVGLSGGPYYPLFTGRRDSTRSFGQLATYELPSPSDNITRVLTSFSQRGFDEREMVSLFGAHSIGSVNCSFFEDRLYNFRQSGLPDPSLDPGFLSYLRNKCRVNSTNSNSMEAPENEPRMEMDEHRPTSAFDTHYYQSLLQGKGILYADQQLMAMQKTATLVQAYASDDGSAFRRDFGWAMMKLSGLGVLSGLQGQVRRNCSQIVS